MLLEGGYAFSWDEVSAEDIIKFSHGKDLNRISYCFSRGNSPYKLQVDVTKTNKGPNQSQNQNLFDLIFFGYAAYNISYHTRAVQSMVMNKCFRLERWPDPPLTAFTTICICYHKSGVTSRLSDLWSVPAFFCKIHNNHSHLIFTTPPTAYLTFHTISLGRSN